MNDSDTGVLLIGDNIKQLSRFYFDQTVQLIGVKTYYRAPLENKDYDGYGELNSFFYPPVEVMCLYEAHPDQKTMKKMGWVAELGESSLIITVPYNVNKLQCGGIFILPSGLDGAIGRVFRVISMQNSPIYPATITCEIAPIYESDDNSSHTVDQGADSSPLRDVRDEDDEFTILRSKKF